MQTAVNGKLTYAYIRKLDKGTYLALSAMVFLILLGIFGFIFRFAENTYPDLVSNIMYPLTSGVGAGWAFTTSYRAFRGPLRLEAHHARAWLLVGLGLLANCLGGLCYTILERTGQTILEPSLPDIGFTLFYPLIFVGLLLMPAVHRFRLSMALDALIGTLCILGVSWFFFISKVFVSNVESHSPLPQIIMAISYPIWDMLLILAILILIYRRANSLFLPSLVLFVIGLLAQVWADTAQAYTLTNGTYYSLNFIIDPFWYLGFLLIGLSGLYQYASICRRAYQKGVFTAQLSDRSLAEQLFSEDFNPTRQWLAQYTLIYLPLAILLVLTIYNEYSEQISDQKGSLFLIMITAVVGVLVAIRSFIASRENERLLSALALAKARQEEIANEKTRLYAELSRTYERMKELDKLKDQFMITASHELRTPLTSIQGYLELLVEYGESASAEQQREFLLKAQRGSEELALLLSNVMDASRLEIDAGIRPAYLQPVNVYDTIQSVISLIEPQVIHEHRKVELQLYDPPSLAVQAEPTRLRQVLLNLSVNALKYSPAESPIIFSARPVRAPGPGVVISVIDKGNGIAQQDQERLFERFIRLERDLNSSTRGSGLGLYISRRLVDAMGGKIWVESSGIAGEGSSFHIQLLKAAR